MNDNLEAYVLDTSAWLTLIEDENGADVVQKILEKSRENILSMNRLKILFRHSNCVRTQ